MILYKMKSDLQMTPDLILSFGKMALNIAGSQRNHKKNTVTVIVHTCNGIVSLCRHLLATSHECILLGQFSTDPLD